MQPNVSTTETGKGSGLRPSIVPAKHFPLVNYHLRYSLGSIVVVVGIAISVNFPDPGGVGVAIIIGYHGGV